MGKDRPRRARHRNLQSGAKALGFLGVRLAGGCNALGAFVSKFENPVKEFVVATRAKKTAKGKKTAAKNAVKKDVKKTMNACSSKTAKKVKKSKKAAARKVVKKSAAKTSKKVGKKAAKNQVV